MQITNLVDALLKHYNNNASITTIVLTGILAPFHRINYFIPDTIISQHIFSVYTVSLFRGGGNVENRENFVSETFGK